MITRLAVPLVAIFVLAGCTTAPQPQPTPGQITASVTCEEYSNIVTMFYNADIAHRDGRTSEQELRGTADLVVAMMKHVETDPASVFAPAVADLQSLSSQDLLDSSEHGMSTWMKHELPLNAACLAAGSGITVEAWTGG